MDWRSVGVPGLAGAAAFWVTNLVISLTPAAADYRAALSISYVPMLVEAAIGGIVIGLGMSWTLERLPDRVPGRRSVAQALLLSVVVLVVVTALIEVPGKLLDPVDRPVHLLLVATAINAVRILALGLVIGLVRRRAADPLSIRTARDR